jgi:hypothetical protein
MKNQSPSHNLKQVNLFFTICILVVIICSVLIVKFANVINL